jgi:hypothetical protein
MTFRKKDSSGRFVKRSGPTANSPSKAAPSAMPAPDGGLDPVETHDRIVDGVSVKLRRDYWRGEDDRVAAGTMITVARRKARELLANDVIEAPGF